MEEKGSSNQGGIVYKSTTIVYETGQSTLGHTMELRRALFGGKWGRQPKGVPKYSLQGLTAPSQWRRPAPAQAGKQLAQASACGKMGRRIS